VFFKHNVKLGVQIIDLGIDLSGQEFNFLLTFELCKRFQNFSRVMNLVVASINRLWDSRSSFTGWVLAFSQECHLEVVNLGLRGLVSV